MPYPGVCIRLDAPISNWSHDGDQSVPRNEKNMPCLVSRRSFWKGGSVRPVIACGHQSGVSSRKLTIFMERFFNLHQCILKDPSDPPQLIRAIATDLCYLCYMCWSVPRMQVRMFGYNGLYHVRERTCNFNWLVATYVPRTYLVQLTYMGTCFSHRAGSSQREYLLRASAYPC